MGCGTLQTLDTGSHYPPLVAPEKPSLSHPTHTLPQCTALLFAHSSSTYHLAYSLYSYDLPITRLFRQSACQYAFCPSCAQTRPGSPLLSSPPLNSTAAFVWNWTKRPKRCANEPPSKKMLTSKATLPTIIPNPQRENSLVELSPYALGAQPPFSRYSAPVFFPGPPISSHLRPFSRKMERWENWFCSFLCRFRLEI